MKTSNKNRQKPAKAVSATRPLSKDQHLALSEILRGVFNDCDAIKERILVKQLSLKGFIRKSEKGLIATQAGAKALDEDSRCPICANENCAQHPRHKMETMRRVRGFSMRGFAT